MEKLSSIERVVGNLPEVEKVRILHEKGARFDNQVFDNLKGKERPKSPEELEIIDLANKATNELRQKYGLEDFDIPARNIHVVKDKDWPDDEKGNAFYTPMSQAVIAREAPSKIAFLKKIYHEMLHFKSYNALQMITDEKSELDTYRTGLTVTTRDGSQTYFTNLNEAVTEEMTKRFTSQLFGNPLFEDETKQTNDVISDYSGAVTYTGEPLFTEDTYYAEVQDTKTWKDALGRIFGTQKKRIKLSTEAFTYKPEREILNTLIDKIFERNGEYFEDKEEVFEVFAEAMMTGNILPIGRLVENTFGTGTFRKIGELDEDIEAQQEFVDSL